MKKLIVHLVLGVFASNFALFPQVEAKAINELRVKVDPVKLEKDFRAAVGNMKNHGWQIQDPKGKDLRVDDLIGSVDGLAFVLVTPILDDLGEKISIKFDKMVAKQEQVKFRMIAFDDQQKKVLARRVVTLSEDKDDVAQTKLKYERVLKSFERDIYRHFPHAMAKADQPSALQKLADFFVPGAQAGDIMISLKSIIKFVLIVIGIIIVLAFLSMLGSLVDSGPGLLGLGVAVFIVGIVAACFVVFGGFAAAWSWAS